MSFQTHVNFFLLCNIHSQVSTHRLAAVQCCYEFIRHTHVEVQFSRRQVFVKRAGGFCVKLKDEGWKRA